MRVTYYVAASLDGFIAGPDGEIDWLDQVDRPGEDYGYGAFIKDVDALILGRATWDFLEGVGGWIYGDLPGRVFSHRPLDAGGAPVTRVEGDPGAVVDDLRAAGHRHVWLVGGGALATALAESGHLTDLIVSVIPVQIGAGLPLFGPGGTRVGWNHVETRSFPSGLVQTHYRRG
ncbi:MAG TPA: dihydrofolate reductase family protein [Longimicrobiales bacterium]|nr:dihydrofolate reductase family protein [Longimicrobiales bacterium]